MATCAEVHTSTDRHPDRVGLIVDAKPSCLCERDSMSANSPGVVNDYEVIIRLVCAPMHVHSKRPELKSSFFSHVFTKGASAQRLDHATDTELVTTIDTLITSADDRLWLGYVQCRAKDIRQINVGEKSGHLFTTQHCRLKTFRIRSLRSRKTLPTLKFMRHDVSPRPTRSSIALNWRRHSMQAEYVHGAHCEAELSGPHFVRI